MAKQSYITANASTIQSFTNAVAKGQKYVKEHTAKEIAEVIKSQFPDSDIDSLTLSIQRYKDADVWNDTPVMKETAFDKLQDVMQEAKQLDSRAPFAKLIDNTFAEKAK
jgi:NitT/TauT family transport system substrate-binding protein